MAIVERSPVFPSQFAVVIPAWQPTQALMSLVEELQRQGCRHLIVLDDGSGSTFAHVFGALEQQGVQVQRHAINLGKGRALKTAFNVALTEMPMVTGLLTADADGQHRAQDITKVAEALATSVIKGEKRIVLGTRRFDGEVPWRSKIGNTFTRYIFSIVTGIRLQDTQTGLRGFPAAIIPEILALNGERYEYEMNMLAHLCRAGVRPIEVPIETVYFDANRASHFNPVRDSMRIYFVLARFYVSSLIAAAFDLLGFTIALALTHHLLFSVLFGRLSSFVNFVLNRTFVFQTHASLKTSFWRYYALAAGMVLLSYGGVWILVSRYFWYPLAAKLCVDTALSLISFSMQRTFVFVLSDEKD